MDTVHVFVSTGRFRSFAEMRTFVEEAYTEDSDHIPSAFAEQAQHLTADHYGFRAR